MARESTLKNMVVVLTLICLASSALLGGAYVLTKEPIEAAQLAKINQSIAGVVPPFDNDPNGEAFTKEYNGSQYKVYPAIKGGETVGYAIETFSNAGFGGRVTLMVGFGMDGTIINTVVLTHSETPGLGDKMVAGKSDFSLQFNGKNPADFKLSVKKDGGDVDAITASTISSRAFCGAMTSAYEVFKLCVADKTEKEAVNE